MSRQVLRQPRPLQLSFPIPGGDVRVSDLTVQRGREFPGDPVHVLRLRTGQLVDPAHVRLRSARMAATTRATSAAAIGEVLPCPNGSSMRPRSRTLEPAKRKKLSRNIVGRTVTTGRPDHPNACSLSQCCRCWWLGVVFWMLICETVICDMLIRALTPASRATAAMVTAASRYEDETDMPK